MEILIDRDALNSALSSVKRIIARRDNIPVLTHVMLQADAGKLLIKGSDMDILSTVSIDCEARQGGSVMLPGHVLADMIKTAPKGGEIKIQSAEGVAGKRQSGTTKDGKAVWEDYTLPRVVVRSGHSAATLSGLPAEDFPESEIFKVGKWSHQFAMPAQDMRRLLDATTFAISTEETRYYLNGVFLHVLGSDFRAVTTDGHRLARIEMPAPAGSEGMPGVIVPRLCVAELARMIGKSKSELSISVNASHIEFRLDGATLLSKLIDGTFPDYSRVIPQGADKRLTVDKDSLVATIKRVLAMGTKAQAVRFKAAPGNLELSISNPDAGDIRDSIGAEWDIEESFEIGFNGRYILDVASAIKGDKIEFAFEDNGCPAIIKDGGDDHALFVLMPLRV